MLECINEPFDVVFILYIGSSDLKKKKRTVYLHISSYKLNLLLFLQILSHAVSS